MKHKLQTLLKHKLQWLLLLAALLGVSQGGWANASFVNYSFVYNSSKTTGGSVTQGNKTVNEGEISSLTITAFYAELKQCNTDGDNLCGDGWLDCRVNNNTKGTSGTWNQTQKDSWTWNNWSNGCRWPTYKAENKSINVYPNYPGDYTLEVKLKSKTSNSCNVEISCSTLSLNFTIPGIAIQPSTSTQSLCVGGSATALSVTAVGSSPSYQWQSATTSGGTYSNIYGANSSSYTPPTSTAGTKYYRCKVTISGTTYTSNASGAIVVNDNPSLESLDGPTQLVVSTNPAGTYTTQSIASATYTWTTTLTSSSGLNSSTSNSVTAYTGSTTQSGKKVSVYATKNGCKSNTVELTGISVVASCSTPSASDINITAPSVKTIIYTGTGNTPSTSAQTITATCSKGDTYLWTAAPSTLSYSGAWGSGTASRVSIASSSSQSTTATFYHEGVYTATFNAGCGNTTDASKTSKTFVVRPGYMYIAGTLLDNSWTFYDSRRVAINTLDSTFTYEWDAAYTSGQFLASVGNRCGEAETSAYTISNYATLTLNNITKDTGGNHNLNPNVGAITLGDKLRLKIEYKGVNSSGIPKYTLTLNKVPVPTTDEPDNITWTQAKLWGTYPKTSEYASISTSESGFYYGTTSSPATKVYNGSQTAGRLAKTIENLTPGTTYYYKAFVVSGGVEYCGAVESFTTTACSNPTISTQPSDTDREYCINDASPATLTVEATGGVGAYTYQWKQCATSGGTYTNVSAGSGGTTATYTPSTATAGELYYKCVVTNSGICTSNSVTSNASGKYTIDATSVAGTISGRSSSQCLGNTRTLTLNTYTGTIQWHVGNASDFTPSSSTAISGATNSTYKAPINEVGTKYYKAVVTNGVCPSATTVTAADITVNRKYQASDFNLSGNTQDYDGNPKTVTVAEKSGAGNGAITIKYAGSTTAPTNAGTYAITIDVKKSSTSPYYCAEDGLSIGTLTINKIDQPTAVTIDNETTSYCVSTLGTNIALEASGGDGTGAYSFTITGGTVAADKRSISGSTLTVSGAGTVILQATRDADTNYNAKNSATVTFTFTANGPKVFTLTNEGATALCGKGDGSSTGTGGSLRLTGSEIGYSYQLKKDDANYGDPVAGTGSALTFPVTSSGVYTCTAYYGVDPSQCPTEMNVEDGGIVLVVNITPRLLPGTPTVRQYQAVTITSTNTEIDKWVLSGEGADAYTYDSTPNSITLKANTAGSPYRLIATTSAGCTATAVITVIADTENCVAP